MATPTPPPSYVLSQMKYSCMGFVNIPGLRMVSTLGLEAGECHIVVHNS